MCEKNEEISEENLDKSAEICYITARDEYNHFVERANKLDNKVYIMITFSGLFFVFIMDLLRIFLEIPFPSDSNSLVLYVVIVFVYIVILIGYIISMLIMFSILKPIDYRRFNPSCLVNKNMHKEKPHVCYMYIAIKYMECLEISEKDLGVRFKLLTMVNIIIPVVVIISVILKFLLILKGGN